LVIQGKEEYLANMKKLFAIGAGLLAFTFVAAAADIPEYETFLGYNFTRFSPDSGYVPSFNANGGSGQFVLNYWKGIGAVLDVGAVNKGDLNGQSIDTTVTHFLLGPRFAYHNSSRWTPFGEIMFGGSHVSTSTQVVAFPATNIFNPFFPVGSGPITTRAVATRTGFAMMTGGGLDIKVNKNFAFRLFEADYYLTRPTNFFGQDVNKNNWRLATGINFMWGEAPQ
jgi:outer membrane immunogenic protein